MKDEKDSRWKAGAALVAAGVTLVVFGALLMTSGGLSPIESVKLTAERSLVLPFAVSRWFDVVGFAAWASFLAKTFLQMRGNQHTRPWLAGGGLLAFAIPALGLSHYSGLVVLVEIAALSGAALGLLLGCLMDAKDTDGFFSGWYQDGGMVIGPGLGIGVSFTCGTAVGLVFGILTGLIASLAYGAALLLVFAAKRILRRG